MKICFVLFCFTYNSQRFGKDTGIFCKPKLRAQVTHHGFIKKYSMSHLIGQKHYQKNLTQIESHFKVLRGMESNFNTE